MNVDILKKLLLPMELMDSVINVVVAGAGGTGGEVIDKLIRLHFGLLGVGHPYGLQVSIYDPSTISQSNLGRQRFTPVDVGQEKAVLLAHRINMAYGLNWQGYCEELPVADIPNLADILITCVDKASVRADIGERYRSYYRDNNVLWLDTGNDQYRGQVILGHLGYPDVPLRIPNCYDLYPELANPEMDEGDTPSCSFAAAIKSQDLPINSMVADAAFALLWNLLRNGNIDRHGAYIDCQELTSYPLMIDPEGWGMYGYKCAACN